MNVLEFLSYILKRLTNMNPELKIILSRYEIQIQES